TLVAPLSTDPVFLLDQIHNSVVSFDFYASFTEPFRTIYFIDTLVLINSADDGPMIYTAATSFDPALPSQTLTFLMDGVNWDALITQGLGSDGMSEIEYPYAVILNSNFHGGGGEEYVQMQ
ncbi:MAG: putative membrane protein, partial [Flavobacteriaceae bacterium]